MKVFIDGISYVPEPDKPEGQSLINALELRFDSDAGENITIREYLMALLMTLWKEGEGFSGKRPFGNSGWEYDIYQPLILAGLINGSIDEHGNIEVVDTKAGWSYVSNLIKAIFNGVQ